MAIGSNHHVPFAVGGIAVTNVVIQRQTGRHREEVTEVDLRFLGSLEVGILRKVREDRLMQGFDQTPIANDTEEN
jgi:hypothetical protein